MLVCGDRVLADSAYIVDEADANAPPGRRLYPDDPDAAAEVRALVRDFDADLGPHGRRWMYNELRGRRDLAIAYGCTGVPVWERLALALAYPAMTRVIDRFLDITAATAAQSEGCIADGARIHFPPEEDRDVDAYYAFFVFDHDGMRIEVFAWPRAQN